MSNSVGPPAFVLPLHQLGRGDLTVAGGKGANLGELVRARFPVPPGFVLTTATYDRFVADNRLGETIGRALREKLGGATIRAPSRPGRSQARSIPRSRRRYAIHARGARCGRPLDALRARLAAGTPLGSYRRCNSRLEC
jgi:hypothetical protein